jgi:Uma2 family endonuclease
MTTYPVRTRRWTRAEYDRLIDFGVLQEDEPVELLGGQMIVAEPKSRRHSTAVGLTGDTLRAAFGAGWSIRVQDPVALDDESEPEPDVVVVPGQHRAYLAAHPERPALVIEVAESSLGFDRRFKSGLYARAGVSDYWIVNVVDDVLEVHRGPVADPGAPDITVAVADLLP